jgi:hypothetical protein
VSPLVLSLIALACISAGAGAGMAMGHSLVKHHLEAESREVLKLAMGLIATLAALVLGLLVAATKGSYDTEAAAIREMAGNVLLLDRLMAIYGPDTEPARDALRRAATALEHDLGSGVEPTGGGPVAARAHMEEFYSKVAGLAPTNDAQRSLKERAMAIVADIGQTRMRMITRGGGSIPAPFLAVLVFWLVILFVGYGLLAPRNATVALALGICAVSVSGALFLILELDHPLDGLMRVSTESLRDAIALLHR